MVIGGMSKRVAIVTDANTHLGPDLARILARRGHDLVLGDPLDGLAEEVTALGAQPVTVTGVADLGDPATVPRLVDAARDRFGRIDAACIRTGVIRTGRFLDGTLEDLQFLQRANLESVFHALQTLLPAMADGGQIVIVTSATGRKPMPNAALHSATRAAANMLVKAAALEVADRGITVNAIGTAYLDYPGFVRATGSDDPTVRAKVEKQVPMKRFGQPKEVAHFCAGLLDGENRFQTGQFFSLSGGWTD